MPKCPFDTKVRGAVRNGYRPNSLKDDDAFDRVYGFLSHPVPRVKGRKLAVRVISQFGEESTKVLAL